MEARSAQVRGRDVVWHVAGVGPPLVLVHGLSGSWRWWEPVLPRLAEGHETHAVDLPRFGAALRPDETAEWLGDWAASAGLERIALVGHSLGGAAAARLAAQRPELVERLVLVSAAGMPSGRRLAGYALPLATALLTTRPGFLARLAVDALRAGPEALLRGSLYAAGADVREQARAVRAPTLLVWGDRDSLVPPELADAWLEAIPQARLARLPGAGHVPMVERPAELLSALEEFLDEPRDLVRGGPVHRVRAGRDDRDPRVR